MPPTRAERQVADTLKEKAQPVVQEVTEMAKDTVQNFQEPARQSWPR